MCYKFLSSRIWKSVITFFFYSNTGGRRQITTLFSRSCYHCPLFTRHTQLLLPSKYFAMLEYSLLKTNTFIERQTVQDSLQATKYRAAVQDSVFYDPASHRMHFSVTCSSLAATVLIKKPVPPQSCAMRKKCITNKRLKSTNRLASAAA